MSSAPIAHIPSKPTRKKYFKKHRILIFLLISGVFFALALAIIYYLICGEAFKDRGVASTFIPSFHESRFGVEKRIDQHSFYCLQRHNPNNLSYNPKFNAEKFIQVFMNGIPNSPTEPGLQTILDSQLKFHSYLHFDWWLLPSALFFSHEQQEFAMLDGDYLRVEQLFKRLHGRDFLSSYLLGLRRISEVGKGWDLNTGKFISDSQKASLDLISEHVVTKAWVSLKSIIQYSTKSETTRHVDEMQRYLNNLQAFMNNDSIRYPSNLTI